MDQELSMPEIAKREENFFNGTLPSTIEGKEYYMELEWLTGNIAIAVNKMQGTYSKKEILRTVLVYVYDFVMEHNKSYRIFDDDGIPNKANGRENSLSKDVFEACFFMSLCMFLYNTRRVRGMSLRKFTYEHSLKGYNVKGSPNYFDPDRPREFLESNSDKPEVSSDSIRKEENNLRQFRKRFLENRPVYHHSSEGSAIRKSSEDEWELYFLLEKADTEIQDTAKRIRTLYDGICKVLKSEKGENYDEKLDSAGSKFVAKLSKITYGCFLNLGEFFLSHIDEDRTCYGLNLYRFEKEMRLYRITTDVNRLLSCDEGAEADRIIELAIQMNDIIFPKLYDYFSNLPDVRQTQFYADTFWLFMDEVVQSSRLVIDKFVEDGVFGEDWEQLFLEATNELAEIVLYKPSEIDYSLEPESQREFQIYLLDPIDRLLKYEKHRFHMSLMPDPRLDDDM